MSLPKVILVDRDATLVCASSDESSPLYYILSPQHLILRPGAREALAIIRAHGIPTYLVTKQRCISKGLISRTMVDVFNARLERMLDFTFDGVLVEEAADNKRALYEEMLVKYRGNPQDVALFDDSPDERTVAQRLGITTYDGSRLYDEVCKVFKVR